MKKLFLILPCEITIFSWPNSGDSAHKVPCQNSDFVFASIPGPKYICFIIAGLFNKCQMISPIDRQYAILEPTEVDGVFLDEIVSGVAVIGNRGNRCLD